MCRELLQPQPWATPATPTPVPESLINYIFLWLKNSLSIRFGDGVSNPTEVFSPSSLQVSRPRWARFGAAEQRDEHCCQLLGDAFWAWHQPGPGSGCVPAPGLLQDSLWRTLQTGDHNPSWEHCVLHSVRAQVLNHVCTDQHHGKCIIREK